MYIQGINESTLSRQDLFKKHLSYRSELKNALKQLKYYCWYNIQASKIKGCRIFAIFDTIFQNTLERKEESDTNNRC